MAIEALRTVVEYHDYVQQLPPDEPTPELMNGRFVMAARLLIRHARYLREILKAIDGYIIVHQLVGQRFLCYERTAHSTASSQPTFRRIAGGLADSHYFPGIAVAPKML